jgi:hypothetical protein
MDLVVIIWRFEDELRYEGPMQRWIAELLMTDPPSAARSGSITPWVYPARSL